MEIKLTHEQFNELYKEGYERDGETTIWGTIEYDLAGFSLYFEGIVKGDKATITYTEANSGDNVFCGDREIYERFCEYKFPRKLTDHMNDCPRCDTPMIYHFNYCPKCGQILRWEEDEMDKE